MPRKKKTIKDYVFSADHTKQINTTHRNTTKKVSSTVLIDFTNEKVKLYRELNIHSMKDEHMMEFLNKLNEIVVTKFDFTQIKIGKKKEVTYACDWQDMPSYGVNNNMGNYGNIKLMIEVVDNEEYIKFIHDYNKVFKIVLWPTVSSMWYPERSALLSNYKDKMYINDTEKNNIQSDIGMQNNNIEKNNLHNPKYPIYIISKGRYEKRYTSKYLEWIGVDYKIIVEPQEFDAYNEHISEEKILVLPNCYLGLGQGSIPARNYAWWHAKESGAERHWILDDNITSYRRFNEGEKPFVKSGAVFRIVEDYVDRYTNVKMAGHNYTMFGVSLNTALAPITMNTRVYSSILLSNDIFPHFTWRGKYNEDTDLSLRILKNGYPTILFNCILADKLKTMTQKGGNTDSIYAEKDGLYKKARSLQKQHDDVTVITNKFGRVHHQVNYSGFKSLKLIYKDDIILENKVNEYGLILVDKNTDDLFDKQEKTKHQL